MQCSAKFAIYQSYFLPIIFWTIYVFTNEYDQSKCEIKVS